MPEHLRDDWRRIRLAKNPRLLVGWREPNRRLDALRVRLHQDVFPDLAGLCRPAINKLQNDRERIYEPFAALEEDQYFWYPHANLPGHEASSEAPVRNASSDADDTADLVRLVQSVDGLDEVTRDSISELDFSFYSICWPHNSMIGFVSRRNPVSTLRPGYRFFQYGDTLKRAERPDFALREGADLVVTREGTAILAPYSFDVLLGDVGVSFEHVDTDVAAVRRALARRIKLSPQAEAALRSESGRTRTNARRLRLLLDRLKAIKLDIASLRACLLAHGEDPTLLLSEDGEFTFDQAAVPLFFDTIEWRFFEDELGGGKRRADRFSQR